jgi:hypothetical protein
LLAPGAGPAQQPGAAGGLPVGPPPGLQGGRAFGPGGARGGAGGAFGEDRSLTAVLSYVRQHGGGTVAVSSQSSAASAIIKGNTEVAGIGGFSGRESNVSVSWLAGQVGSGRIRWVLGGQSGAGFGRGLPGDTRTGSKTAMAAVAKACRRVSFSTGTSAASGGASGSSAAATLYDCHGRAGALASAGAR